MIETKHIRIAAGGTIPITTKSLTLRQIVMVVSNAGTNWHIRIEDNDSSPAIIIPDIVVSAPATASWINEKFEHPLPLVDGMDFVTISGTPGVLDLWYSYDRRSIQ